jgi:3-dehydroquinate dehydratase type I
MICTPIIAQNSAEALRKIAEAEPLADIMEIRLDLMKSFDLKEILNARTKPVLVTYRSTREGGRGAADYESQMRYLMNAVEDGADFVDVEYRLPLKFRQKLFQHQGVSQFVLSTHLLHGTPSREELDEIFRKMAATGADIIKIVAHARSWEDNLRVLELIPKAQALGIKIIAFCMGPVGRISRVFTHLMGGYVTFASVEHGQQSASGQMPVREMKRMLEILSS